MFGRHPSRETVGPIRRNEGLAAITGQNAGRLLPRFRGVIQGLAIGTACHRKVAAAQRIR